MKSVNLSITFILAMVFAGTAQKKKINSVDDIPRFTYKMGSKASEIFNDNDKFQELYKKVEQDFQMLVREYEFNDDALKKDILSTLKQIDFFESRYKEAMKKVMMVREIETKPAAKLTSGIINEAYLNSVASFKPEAPDFSGTFKSNLKVLVDKLPYQVVQDEIKGTKGSFEMFSDNLIYGLIDENLDPASKDGKLSGDVAAQLIWYKYTLLFVMPHRQQVIEVYDDYLKANFVEKENIWESRDRDITDLDGLTSVTIAIWDSGIDEGIFGENMFVNPQEKMDSTDTDGNGYVDDVNGIAYNLTSDKVSGNLFPLTDEQKEMMPSTMTMYKGLSDLQANIESEESKAFKAKMSQLQKTEVKPFIEQIGLFGIYAHGTHVAGIATKGNPAARLMVSRITFDHRMIPLAPTIELYKKGAIQAGETVEYFRNNGVRVVNMSFGETPQSVEGALEANGIGESAEERRKMAREMFDIGKKAFYEAIEKSPDILFVAAAGNSDEDSEFYEAIPSSFNLPNILTVGAVDQAGEETGFTSFGDNVDVHANGFEVESFVPGGKVFKLSGTSMASPNVANLAGKLLAIKPELSVQEVIKLITDYCDRSEDGRINLINPGKSIEAVQRMP